MSHRILVVEDNPTLGVVLRDNLESEGYLVDVVTEGTSAIKAMQPAVPDLIVLDLMLPDCDGFDLFPVLRHVGQVPIIILSARAQLEDKLKGLHLGADDYITKPFALEELLARIRSVLLRSRPSVRRIRLGEVTIDFVTMEAFRGKRRILLTRREFELLSYLAERQKVVVRRGELLRAIWGYLDTDTLTRAVDFAIARLRRKIEADHRRPKYIRTAHGDGYCLRGVSDEDTEF